jgi:hypothetical protein
MARLPFKAVLKAPGVGNTTYQIPAGKFAVCNCFNPVGFWGAPGVPQSGSTSNPRVLKLNGQDAVTVFSFAFQRYGPMVFNQGDILGCSGYYDAGAVNPSDGQIAINGFLYDVSTRKEPVNQIMVVGSSSYTVPAGKHIVFNMFPAPIGGAARIMVDTDSVGISIASITFSGAIAHGPHTANAGQVISLQWATGTVIPAGFSATQLLTGFTYTNVT